MKQAVHLFHLFEPDSDVTLAILPPTHHSDTTNLFFYLYYVENIHIR